MNTKAKLAERAIRRANFCSVFSNPFRVLILWSLAEGEMSVTEIACAINSSLQNTSQHLSLMKSQDILSSRRDGQTIYYRIEHDHFKEMCCILDQIHQEELLMEE